MKLTELLTHAGKTVAQSLGISGMITASFISFPISKYISGDKPIVVWEGNIDDGEGTFIQKLVFLEYTHLFVRRNEDKNNPESRRCYLYVDKGNEGRIDYCGAIDSFNDAILSTEDFDLRPIKSFPKSAAKGMQIVYDTYNQIINMQKESQNKQ